MDPKEPTPDEGADPQPKTPPRCEHCGRAWPAGRPAWAEEGYFWLPIEPMFDLAVAAQLLPMHPASLRKLLSRHKAAFPARYRRSDSCHRRIRLLSATEIRRLRAMVVREPNPDTVLRSFLPPPA